MVRTSTAERNGFICPSCKDGLNRDHAGRGYVTHLHNSECEFEKGDRDDVTSWRQAENDDPGSLRTGDVKLQVGATIRIQGESKDRTVTYTLASNKNVWRAYFKGQGAVPVGPLEWKVIGMAPPKEISQMASGSTERQASFDFHTVKGIVEFIAALLAIIGTIVGLIVWLLQ